MAAAWLGLVGSLFQSSSSCSWLAAREEQRSRQRRIIGGWFASVERDPSFRPTARRQAPLPPHMPPSPKRTNQAPSAACPGLLCHLCGKQFGSASLEIHQRTCRLRYEREHGRAAPEAPAGGDNEAAAQFYESEVMEACPHCARTFLPGRLEVHLRSCKGPATPRSSPSPCPVCSRLLTPAQMLGHSRLCKADVPTPPRPTSTAEAIPSSHGLARVGSAPTVGSAPPRNAALGSAARGRGGGGPSASVARLPLPRPSPARQPSGPPRQARTEGRDAAITPEGAEGQCSSPQRTGTLGSAASPSLAHQQAARGDTRARLEHVSTHAEGASRGSGPAKAGRGRGGGRPVRERLVELNALLEASLITEEECRVKREQILAEL